MADPRVNYRITAIDETKKAISGIKSNFAGLKTIIAGLGVGLSLGAIGNFIGDTIKKTDELGKLTRKIKVDVEEFQRLTALVGRENIGPDVLGKALEGQARKVAEAMRGAGDAVEAFKSINLDPASLFGQDPIQQFQAIALALQSVGDSGTQLFAAQKIWEQEGTGLLNVVRDQAFELQRLDLATDNLTVKTQEQVDQAEALVTSWTVFKESVASAAEALALGFVPVMQDVADWLVANREEFAALGRTIAEFTTTTYGQLKSWATDLIELIANVLAFLRNSAMYIGTFGQEGGFNSNSVAGNQAQGGGTIQRFDRPVFSGVPNGALE